MALCNAIDECVKYLDKHGIQEMGEQVNKMFPGKLLDAELPKLLRPEVGRVNVTSVFGKQVVFHPVLDPPPPQKNLKEIMRRIQKHVFSNGIRTGEFFEDFDLLRTGKMAENLFRRGLDGMGVSGLDRLYLKGDEIDAIVTQYQDPNDEQRVCWETFQNDVDLVFTAKGLERLPELKLQVPPLEIKELPRENAKDWEHVPVEKRDLVEVAVSNVKATAMKRGINLRPPFQHLDPINTGHVTRAGFRQAIQTNGIYLSGEELYALEDRYNDIKGFNYLWFLMEVEPKSFEEPLFKKLVLEKKRLNNMVLEDVPENCEKDIVAILGKVKSKVVQERMYIYDFMRDYDHHNELCISTGNFNRALDASGLKLTQTEIGTIDDVFASPRRRGMVDHRRFCELVEQAFTQTCLERAPLVTPVQFVPSDDKSNNFLSYEERKIFALAMEKLSKKPDVVVNISSLFADLDRTNCGTVNRTNFFRALTGRDMQFILTKKELATVYKGFGIRRGLRDEVDYRAFLRAIDLIHATKHYYPF